MSAKSTIGHCSNATRSMLVAPGWNQEARAGLVKLLQGGAGKRLPVVFDFDNTVVHGDIGEATMAMLARSGQLTPANVSACLCPSFRRHGKALIELHSCVDVIEYYNALLAPTIHGSNDPSPLANGYAWAVKVMSGLRLADVVKATRQVVEVSRRETVSYIEVTPGKTSFRVPTFHPEVVELLAELIRHEFDVWIVSASNVWSVRWMVLHALNPLLCERHQISSGIPANHVIGISTLLADDHDYLFKDMLLVRENPAYAAMEAGAVSTFRLTSHLQFPAPSYSGKVACIFDAIGRRPYLCIGDGPGDQAMMDVSEHQLWIAPQGKDQTLRVTRVASHSVGESDREADGGPSAVPPPFLGKDGFVPVPGRPNSDCGVFERELT